MKLKFYLWNIRSSKFFDNSNIDDKISIIKTIDYRNID